MEKVYSKGFKMVRTSYLVVREDGSIGNPRTIPIWSFMSEFSKNIREFTKIPPIDAVGTILLNQVSTDIVLTLKSAVEY